MDAKLLINDGQHRKAALLEAIIEDESLCDETISIVFFADAGLERSQQMFTDLNKHAVKTSNSIAELYDFRDPLAVITRKVIPQVPFFERYTDKERDILGKYSSNLFTLNTLYNANKRIVQNKTGKSVEDFLCHYWQSVATCIVPWRELENRQLSKVDLREKYIATQAVVIQVLGRLGNFFYENPGIDYKEVLTRLKSVDWRRDAPLWKNRTIRTNGRMITSEAAIILTCNALKSTLGIPLTPEEEIKEKEFIRSEG